MDDQQQQANGVLVVRRPDFARRPSGQPIEPLTTPAGSVFYTGLDREPWEELVPRFYEKVLPDPVLARWEQVRSMNRDLLGTTVCMDIEIARDLLAYSKKVSDPGRNELIAVRSAALSGVKGTIMLNRGSVAWLGYDAVALGSWSILVDELFLSQDAFPGWPSRLNRDGLLTSVADVRLFARAYGGAAARRQVERVPTPFGVEAIEIGRVKLAQ